MKTSMKLFVLTAVLTLALTGPSMVMAGSHAASSAPAEGETSRPMAGAADTMMGMHGQGGMMGGSGMGMMGGSGMHGHGGAEAPWISMALQQAQELALSGEQIDELKSLRIAFEKQAIRQSAEIRVAELELSELLDAQPVNLPTVEEKVRQVASLRAELRMERIRTLEQGKAVLTAEQRGQLQQQVAKAGAGGHGSMMGGAGMGRMHEMVTRMGNGDHMAGMRRMMEMMGGMGEGMGSGEMMPEARSAQ